MKPRSFRSVVPLALMTSTFLLPVMGGAATSLRQSLQAEAVKLGALSGWQKKVLEEEVLAQPQSFVLQERTEADGTSKFDFDLETVKRLLSLGCGDAPARCGALVLVRTPAKCPGCEEKLPVLERQIQTFLARRGFKPAVASEAALSSDLTRARGQLSSPQDSLEPSEWESERAWQQVLANSTSGGTDRATAPRAIVLVSVQELQDTSHAAPDAPAEESGRPAMRVALGYRDAPSSSGSGSGDEWNWAVARWTGVHAGDTLAGPLGRLFGDVATELVVRLDLGLRGRSSARAAAAGGSSAPLGGFSVRVLGIRDFQQYTRARNVLSAALISAGFQEPFEQAMRRGEVLWRILPEKSGAGQTALLNALRAARPGDPGLGEKPGLRMLDPANAEDRNRIEALEEASGADPDQQHPLFRDAGVTVELPGEEHKR